MKAAALVLVDCDPRQSVAVTERLIRRMSPQMMQSMSEAVQRSTDSIWSKLPGNFPDYSFSAAQGVFNLMVEADRENSGIAGPRAAVQAGEAMLKVT